MNHMNIKGLGIDAASIAKTSHLVDTLGDLYLKKIYTENELKAAERSNHKMEYLASRYAVKEAFYKAANGILQNLDVFSELPTAIEALSHKDGSPYLHMSAELEEAFINSQLSDAFVSITTENDLAIAIVLLQ